MRKINLSVIFLLLILTGSVNLVYGQDDTLSVKDLSEIVVTGQYKPQSLKQSVYQVKVIPGNVIRSMGPTNVQTVLQNQLNMRFQHDAATGGSNLSMMGLPGQNVKILLDGIPLIGRQGFNNEININQIDVHTIDRIEIVEGPMSVIYGADALAGVVNIITKKQSRDKYGVGLQLQEETIGKEYGLNEGIHIQNISAFVNKGKFYFNGNVGRNDFSGWKDTAKGRELRWHSKRQFTGSAALGYKSKKLHTYYRFDGLDELLTNPADFPSSGEPAIDQEYISQRMMHQLQASYILGYRADINASASYTHFARQVYSSLFYPNGDVRGVSTPGLNTMTTINGFNFRASLQYRPYKFLSFQPGLDINLEDGEGERIKQGVQKVNDFAFYLTSEIKPLKNLNVKPGIRLIENSVYNAPPVVPSLHAKYNINARLDVRAAYARGFRAPSLRELYYDFVDASHNIVGNPNLKAEHSDSYTASITYSPRLRGVGKATTTLSGFMN
ncbi:MAG: TonB-dependent receptor, partial [Chitinophagaceae bacterium]